MVLELWKDYNTLKSCSIVLIKNITQMQKRDIMQCRNIGAADIITLKKKLCLKNSPYYRENFVF